MAAAWLFNGVAVAEDQLVKSHGYVYTLTGEPGFEIMGVPIVVEQPDTIAIYGCNITIEQLPDTPKELVDLLQDPRCSTSKFQNVPDGWDVQFGTRLIFQSLAKRYLFLASGIVLLPEFHLSSVQSLSMQFNSSAPGTIASILSYQAFVDQQNPEFESKRLTGFLKYDAEIMLPEIKQKPVIQ